jgi:hypothetical protein
MANYSKTPKATWIFSRYNGRCSKCKAEIRKYDFVYWTRGVKGVTCGKCAGFESFMSSHEHTGIPNNLQEAMADIGRERLIERGCAWHSDSWE